MKRIISITVNDVLMNEFDKVREDDTRSRIISELIKTYLKKKGRELKSA